MSVYSPAITGAPRALEGRSEVPSYRPGSGTARRPDSDRLVDVRMMAAGVAKGHPGTCGFAAIRLDSDGTVLAFEAGQLGYSVATVAGYRGVLLALKLAEQAGASTVTVESDSKAVVRQLNGDWSTDDPDLLTHISVAEQLAGRFEAVTYRYVLTERNDVARDLAIDACDGRPVRQPRPLVPLERRGRALLFPGGTPLKVHKGLRNMRTELLNRSVGETAVLARELGLQGSVDDIAGQLIDAAPERLAAIWTEVFDVSGLASRIQLSPRVWRDVYEHGGEVKAA